MARWKREEREYVITTVTKNNVDKDHSFPSLDAAEKAFVVMKNSNQYRDIRFQRVDTFERR